MVQTEMPQHPATTPMQGYAGYSKSMQLTANLSIACKHPLVCPLGSLLNVGILEHQKQYDREMQPIDVQQSGGSGHSPQTLLQATCLLTPTKSSSGCFGAPFDDTHLAEPSR